LRRTGGAFTGTPRNSLCALFFCYDTETNLLWPGDKYALAQKEICFGPERNLLWHGKKFALTRKEICFGGESNNSARRKSGFVHAKKPESIDFTTL